MPALPLPSSPARSTTPSLVPSRRLIQAGAGGLLALLVLGSFQQERYQPWVLLVCVVLFTILAVAGGWWPGRRALALTLAFDILLIFLYLWSLDDHLSVVITATPAGYRAQIGQDVAFLPVHPRAGHVGIQASPLSAYRVQPTGEAFPPPATDPLTTFGEWMRLAVPQTGWFGLRLTSPAGARVNEDLSRIQTLHGAWSLDRRGDLEGSPGSVAYLPVAPLRDYVMSAELARPDGTQGILVGVQPSGTGYVLAIRMDQPDAIWFRWQSGTNLAPVAGVALHVDFIEMLQRVLRFLLGNIVTGFILLFLAIPTYLLIAALLRLGGRGDEVERLERILRRPGFAGAIGLAAAAGGVLATALIANGLLQSIPHVQDSVAYLFQAKTLALGRLSVPVPRLPTFFTEEFIPMHHGMWFGKYPPGWPVLLAIGVLAHVPWLVDPVLAGIDLLILYMIGREVYGSSVALLATVLALSSPFFLFLGGSFMAHTSTLFYLSGFAYLVLRWVRSVERGQPFPPVQSLLPAGFLLGMAFITRELDALSFSLPFAALAFSRPVFRRLPSLRWLVLGGLIPGAFLLIYNWRVAGSPFASTYALWWPADHPGFGPNVGEMGGFTPAQGLWNTGFNLQMLLAHLFGWPFYLTLALAAVPFVAGRGNRWDALFAASALSVIAAYVFYWTPGVMYGPRYYYVAIPWLALLTARGLEELYRWPLRLPWIAPSDRLAALLVPTLLGAALLIYNLRVYLPAQVPIYHGYNFSSAASIDAVQRAGIHHALIFVASNPPGQWWSYGEVFSSNSPLLDTDVVYARDLGRSDRNLIRLYPGRHYYRLVNTQLTRLSP